MKKVEAWKCDFCRRTSATKAGMTSHERRCKNNPVKRHCITCVHGTEIDWERPVELTKPLAVESYMPGYTTQAEVYAGPWCDYHRMPICQKPYMVECDISGGVDVGIGTIPERSEPWTCGYYEYKGYAGWGAPKNGGTDAP